MKAAASCDTIYMWTGNRPRNPFPPILGKNMSAVLTDSVLPGYSLQQYKAGSLVYDKAGDFAGTGVLLEDTTGPMHYGKVKFGDEVIGVQLADKEHCGWVGFHGVPGAPAVELLS